jgi:hypothetical protein
MPPNLLPIVSTLHVEDRDDGARQSPDDHPGTARDPPQNDDWPSRAESDNQRGRAQVPKFGSTATVRRGGPARPRSSGRRIFDLRREDDDRDAGVNPVVSG